MDGHNQDRLINLLERIAVSLEFIAGAIDDGRLK